MKPPFLHIICLVLALASLSGCGTIDEIFKSDNNAVLVSNADSGMTPAPNGSISSLPPTAGAPRAPGQPYAGNFDPNNLMSVYNQISRGGVQMYDQNQNSIPQVMGGYSGGVPSPQDSRVTVFPMEGSYLADIQQGSPMNMGDNPYSGQSSYGAVGGHAGSPVYTPGNAQIFFKHGSSRLGSGDEQVLSQVAEQARFSPVDRISVEGHASTRAATGDPVTDRVVNLKQSMDRTLAVSRSLMMKGVPAEKIRATSWGDTRQPQGMDESQARRVDIYTGGGY